MGWVFSMIEVLRIDNLALVESVELAFSSGLNVLTGETGAGKSIVLSALALLNGARATSDSLRRGAEVGSVEALFRMDGHDEVTRELFERGLMSEPVSGEPSEAELIVRRTLHANGRSRARIGGSLVPIAALTELFGGQLEISSQHGSQALRRPAVHAELLDAFAGKTSLRGGVARHVNLVGVLDQEIASLQAAEEERARRLDFLRFQQSELAAEKLDAEGIATLEAEHQRLTHAEALAEEMASASAALGGIEGAEGGGSAEDAVATARRGLSNAVRMDSSLEGLASRLEDLQSELRDLAVLAADYLAELEMDPRRLAEVEEKIAGLEKLRRKYGQRIEDMLDHREEVEREIDSLVGTDERIVDLQRERAEAVSQANEASLKLSKARARGAEKLSKSVEAQLVQLAMEGARFVVVLEEVSTEGGPQGLETGVGGRERPGFHFSANQGELPRPIQKVASGGELSRLFLAIKNSLRRTDRNLVIVFDEVDAGIGGAVAERVGRVLAELATEHQVLCITHLPQIAAFADRHFVVRKATEGGRTRSEVQRVEGDLRVEELARMAGGEEVTEVTRQHARSLLNSPA